MDWQQAEKYMRLKPETLIDFPFGEEVKVFKVKGKMFATLSLATGREKDVGSKMDGHYCLNLKCDPDEAIMLRDIFDAVIPGYHMNKKLWNTIILNGTVPSGEVERMIDNSFDLVVSKMPKRDQVSLRLHME